jgi:hypothetical protein
LGERLLCKQEVIGSIPFTSTTDICAANVPSGSGALAPRERDAPRCGELRYRASTRTTSSFGRGSGKGTELPAAMAVGSIFDR